MSKIKVFTDSPADVPPELIQKLNIGLFAIRIFFGEQSFRDYIDIGVKEFYEKLRNSGIFPTTAQVNVNEFYEGFLGAANEGYDTVICFTLPPEASGTFQNANIAKAMLMDEQVKLDIEIIPGSLAYVYGRLVIQAAEMAQQGYSKEEILKSVQSLRDNCYVVFVADTLKYLKKGGRINPTVAAVGEVLNIKPLLTIQNGLVSAVDKVRGYKRVFPRMMELLAQNKIEQAKEIYVFDGDAGEQVFLLQQCLKENFQIEHTVIAPVGPVIGAHIGPGVVGVLFFR